ncbi:hypothetical protein [Fibrobacter sp. UWS1]|uniref:hypothetical protein n=1 Tax=Fibrobacter sp. UWS1 TaxID=1896220 RepID=UPI00117B3C1F|nr:hypothetical protein [Fibrobacter sp. UWS1]
MIGVVLSFRLFCDGLPVCRCARAVEPEREAGVYCVVVVAVPSSGDVRELGVDAPVRCLPDSDGAQTDDSAHVGGGESKHVAHGAYRLHPDGEGDVVHRAAPAFSSLRSVSGQNANAVAPESRWAAMPSMNVPMPHGSQPVDSFTLMMPCFSFFISFSSLVDGRVPAL